MGRLAARAAVAAGASVAVANRSADGAEALAASTGARIEAFDPEARIGGFAGVVVALAGPWPIGAATIDALAGSATAHEPIRRRRRPMAGDEIGLGQR